MTPTATIPTQTLLYQRQTESSHSTRKQGSATESAFSDYGFGPVNTGDRAKGSSAATANTLTGYGAASHAKSWITQVQGA